jgi:hypothetical protein
MNKHHRINYIEFQAKELEAVKKFYTATFGWQFTDYGPDYVAFNDGSLDGGFRRSETKGGSGALVILYSDNLETSLEDVKANGGSIIKPIFSFPGGRRFHFADPSGNELAVWSDK